MLSCGMRVWMKRVEGLLRRRDGRRAEIPEEIKGPPGRVSWSVLDESLALFRWVQCKSGRVVCGFFFSSPGVSRAGAACRRTGWDGEGSCRQQTGGGKSENFVSHRQWLSKLAGGPQRDMTEGIKSLVGSCLCWLFAEVLSCVVDFFLIAVVGEIQVSPGSRGLAWEREGGKGQIRTESGRDVRNCRARRRESVEQQQRSVRQGAPDLGGWRGRPLRGGSMGGGFTAPIGPRGLCRRQRQRHSEGGPQ